MKVNMDLNQLNTTLIGIENALLRRKCAQLESDHAELDDVCEGLIEAYEAEGHVVDTSAASGTRPSGEAYQGYDVGKDGKRHMDGGGTKNSEAEKARAKACANKGGPDDKGKVGATVASMAKSAHTHSSRDREDRGDVDHGIG